MSAAPLGHLRTLDQNDGAPDAQEDRDPTESPNQREARQIAALEAKERDGDYRKDERVKNDAPPVDAPQRFARFRDAASWFRNSITPCYAHLERQIGIGGERKGVGADGVAPIDAAAAIIAALSVQYFGGGINAVMPLRSAQARNALLQRRVRRDASRERHRVVGVASHAA